MGISLFCIPGLGFTQALFQNLQLDVEEIVYLDWIEPIGNEEIEAYAKRMGAGLSKAKYPVVLLGHSFGGIMSIEISKLYPVQKLILASSAKSRADIPLNLKLAKPLGIYHFFTKELCVKTLKYWGETYGYAKGEEQDLFKFMVGKQSNNYLQWALKTLSGWKSLDKPTSSFIHIHGDKDMTLPHSSIQEPFQMISGGTHMMIYNKAAEIQEIIQQEIYK